MEAVYAAIGTAIVVSTMMFLVYVYKRRKLILAVAINAAKGRS